MNKLFTKWYHPVTESADKVQRNYFLDNLKFILIILVVVAHFTMRLAYVKEIKYLMYFIYMFHMPCFVFINGFLAKRMNSGGKLRVDKILIIFWMYLLFKVGSVLLGYAFGIKENLGLFKDESAPWYLLALCFWYLSVPLLERIRTRYLITGSFLIGLIAGYIGCFRDLMSLSRILVFFPFFIIGFCLPQTKLETFLDKRVRLVAVVFLLFIGTVLSVFYWNIKPFLPIIYGASPYSESLESYAKYGFLIRGIWYLVAVSMSAATMLLVPRCRLFFTELGGRTMQVYMIHIWVRNALVYIGFFQLVKEHRTLVVPVLLGSVLLTFVLSNKWLKKLFDHLMTPKFLQKLFKKA